MHYWLDKWVYWMCERQNGMQTKGGERRGGWGSPPPPFSVYIWSKYSILWIPSNPGVLIFNLKTSFSVLFISSYHNGTVTFCRNGNREKESSLTRGCISNLSAISPQSTPNRKSICGDLHVMLIGREKPIFIFFYCPCSFPIRSWWI